MKKVLFVTSLYHPHVGGIETMVTELAQFYKTKGIKSIVLTKKWPEAIAAKDIFQNNQIYRVLSARTENDFVEVAKWISINQNELKADLIHIIGARRPLPLFGVLLGYFWNVPVITTIAGSEIPVPGDPNTNDVWNEGKELIRPVLEHTDIVTFVSKDLEKNFHSLKINLKNAKTLYAGIDLELIRKAVPKSFGGKYIFSLRRLIPSKGIDVLIKGFREIADQYSDIMLVIAGEGPEEENLKSLVRKLDLEGRVSFIGIVSLPEAISLLKSALCTVVPSLSEGGALVNVEAQAAACPVVASNIGGIPEYVRNGKSGLLFEAGNPQDLAQKLTHVLSDENLRKRLIAGGLEYSKKFGWDALGPKYLKLYEEAIQTMPKKKFNEWSPLSRLVWDNLK